MAFGVTLVPLTPWPPHPPKPETRPLDFLNYPMSDEQLHNALNNLDFTAIYDELNALGTFDYRMPPDASLSKRGHNNNRHAEASRPSTSPTPAPNNFDYAQFLDFLKENDCQILLEQCQERSSAAPPQESDFGILPEFDESMMWDSPIDDEATFAQLLAAFGEVDSSPAMPSCDHKTQLEAKTTP